MYKTILSIVNYHDCITKEDIDKFKKNFNRLKGCNDALFFSLKSLEDTNGLHHLLSVSDGTALREADIRDCYQKIVTLVHYDGDIRLPKFVTL